MESARQFATHVTVGLPGFFVVSLAAFTAAALASATHDIAADGFYLHALDAREQALFSSGCGPCSTA